MTPTTAPVSTPAAPNAVPEASRQRPPAGGCQPDPAATIAALPSGGVFHGSGCYLTTGIEITKPVTIDGGTYNDTVSESNGPKSVSPIIRVKNTSNVTIENVVLNGTDLTGGYHRGMVNEAGLDVLSSDHVSLINVATNNTYGDGVTLFSQFGVDHNPVTNLYVNGLTVTNAGRQGITMGYVNGAVMNNVNVVSAAEAGWDFESDLPNIGSGNVVVNNAIDGTGIHMIEALQGPITFNNCQCVRHLHVFNGAAASGQLITFNGGSYALARNSDTGDEIAGIVVDGPGQVVMNQVQITRLPGNDAPHGPSISVTHGGHLTLDDSPPPAPVGGADRRSTLTVRS